MGLWLGSLSLVDLRKERVLDVVSGLLDRADDTE